MNTTTPVRVLPADVYDTLELSALAWGGIGAGSYRSYEGTPLCVIGHVSFLEAHEIAVALRDAGIGIHQNDAAVRRVTHGRGVFGRITFRAWARELNVVRGDV